MKKTILFFTVLICGFAFGQDVFKYSSFKMDNSKKSYNMMVDYDKNKSIKKILIDVESEDVLFDKASYIIRENDLLKFTAYLSFILSKKMEWDIINKNNKTKDVIKKIEWDLGDVLVNCVYTDGPVKINTYLYTMYTFSNNYSTVIISTAGSNDVKSSTIFFSSNILFENFIKKLDLDKIQNAINIDASKKELLK